MPAERFYLNDSLRSQEVKELKGNEFHHLAHVMRLREGEEIELVNGKGALAKASITKIGKDAAQLKLLQVEESSQDKPKIILAQGMPKPNRLDFIIEKGTELGVDLFWLFPAALSVKKDLSTQQMERIQLQLIAAMKQCGRLTLPEIALLPPIAKWKPMEGTLLFGDLSASAPLLYAELEARPPKSPIIFVTGPESGFTHDEEAALRQLGYGVKLHSHILRTDTASLLAVGLIHHWNEQS